MPETLAWYLAVQVAAVAAWPLVGRVFAGFDDRGWVAAKIGGPLLLAWLVWLLAMVTPLPLTRATLALVVLGIALVGWAGLRRGASGQLLAPLRQRASRLLVFETLFAVAFGFFALLRAYEPAIAGTEKPMDMAFLNGFVAAERLPTHDTWLAGYGVPYYYFGYFVFACLAKLSGVAAATGYNLAAATVPALTLAGICGLAWILVRAAGLSAAAAGVAAGLSGGFVVFAGNLTALLERLVATGLLSPEAGPILGVKSFAQGVVVGQWPPPGAWWWRAARVVPTIQPDGINEFPFFSAFLSDLHPHFMALPFETLLLWIVALHVLSGGRTLRSPWVQGAAALLLGAFLAMNTWDLAPFWSLYVAVAWLVGRDLRRRDRLLLAVAAPALGLLLYAPYFVGYGGPPLGLGVVAERTPPGSMLVLFGPQIALLAALGVWARWRVPERRALITTAAGAALGLGLAAIGEPTLGLLVALTALLLPWPGTLEKLPPPAAFATGLAAFAAAILLGVELVFLRDTFGTRMNTVFKLHYNAWLLAGLAVGVGTMLVAGSRWRGRWAVVALAALALSGGLVYPVSAVQTRLASRPPGGPSLDGSAFLPQDERAAIRWLAGQTGRERPVVAEAVGGEYSSGARMATYSGAASVLGWPGHELQWRGPLPELARREADLAQLYRGADPDGARAILARYQVDFVVVGDLERQQYGPEVDRRFADLLPVAYRTGRVTLYRASPG